MYKNATKGKRYKTEKLKKQKRQKCTKMHPNGNDTKLQKYDIQNSKVLQMLGMKKCKKLPNNPK